jgi:Superinfection immunity protein
MIYELTTALASLADDDNTGHTGSGVAGLALGFILLVITAFFYFIPTIVAVGRKVRNVGSVVVVNLFFGWTVIGWVVALAMAMRTVDRDKEI